MFKLGARMRVRVRLFRKLAPVYALFVVMLCLIGVLYDVIAQASIGILFLFTSFLSLRYRYTNSVTYHSESTKKCIFLSISIFFGFAIPLIVFNSRVSLLTATLLALFMTWLLYVIGMYVASLRSKPFDLDNCTEEELVERCRQCFTRDVEYKTERAIKHFILKLPHEQIDVNPEQSKKERYRFRKLLR